MGLQCSLSCYGLLFRLAPQTGYHCAGQRTYAQRSGLHCRGNFSHDVTAATGPLPIQPNGKLLNQTPFILEVKKVRNSYTEGTGVAARPK